MEEEQNKKPIIYHIIEGMQLGGRETLFRNFVEQALKNDRFDHRFVGAFGPGPMSKELEKLGVELEYLHIDDMKMKPALDLFKRMKDENVALVQAWGEGANIALGIAGRTKMKDIPVVWRMGTKLSDHELDQFNGADKLKWKFFYKLTEWGANYWEKDAVIATSKAAEDVYREILKTENILTIDNSIPLEHHHPDNFSDARTKVRDLIGVSPKTPVIGVTSTNKVLKDVPAFMEAMYELHQIELNEGRTHYSNPPFTHFLMAGRDMTAEHPDIAKCLDMHPEMKEFFHLLGPVPHSQIGPIHAGIDLYASTSQAEGLSNTALEVMASGTPIIFTDVASMRDVIKGFGTVVPPRDYTKKDNSEWFKSYASVVHSVMENQRQMTSLEQALNRERRIEHVRQHYSIENMTDAYEDVYQDVIDGKKIGTTNKERKAGKFDVPNPDTISSMAKERADGIQNTQSQSV